MTWRATVLTLFPEMFPGPLGQSLAGRALKEGIWALDALQIRDFAADKHRTVDDTPCGGGAGMVLRADVVDAACEGADIAGRELVYLTPRGAPLSQAMVREFNTNRSIPVFLISLKAGGRGLNLTKATYVYHMGPWWNPAVENQASDRAHRIGQTEQVTIIRLIMRHTIEEKMMTLKAQKSALYTAILEDGVGGGGAGLSREDFDFLLG